MIKYQLRLSTRRKDGKWDHKYSKLYDSVAACFANPAFASYIQEHHTGVYHTITVLSVPVANKNVQIVVGLCLPTCRQKATFFLLTFNKYAYVQIYTKSPVNGSRSMQYSCRYYVVSLYEQFTNQSQWSGAIHNGNTVYRCWTSSIYIIL